MKNYLPAHPTQWTTQLGSSHSTDLQAQVSYQEDRRWEMERNDSR